MKRRVVDNLPLSQNHHWMLVKDILNNHQEDCCGSQSECEQLERTVKSLMIQSGLDENTKNVLDEIYQYSQSGIHAANLESHIEAHQQQLSGWVQDIDQYS